MTKTANTIEDYLSIIKGCQNYEEIPELSNLYKAFNKMMTIVKNKKGKFKKLTWQNMRGGVDYICNFCGYYLPTLLDSYIIGKISWFLVDLVVKY